MYRDTTQVLIDEMRHKVRLYPFKRLQYWFIRAIVLIATIAVIQTVRFVFINRAALLALLTRS